MAAKIISGNRTAEDIVRAHLEKKRREEAQKPKEERRQPTPSEGQIPAHVHNAGDYLVLEKISCVGDDDTVFEQYDTLHVPKDVVRHQVNDENGAIKVVHKPFTPYQGVVHFEQQQNGLFLPSSALSCNVVVAIYRKAIRKENGNYVTVDAEVKKVLDQYKDHGAGWGWHAQNTVINWGTGHIIHYPYDAHFPSSGGTHSINQSQPHKRLAFDRTSFADMTLENALQIPNFKKYIRNLTGLANPADLVEIGNYFGKPAKVWVSSSNETRAAWFGCDSSDLNLGGSGNLDSSGAARGVRRSAP